jgi:hypothetical protein
MRCKHSWMITLLCSGVMSSTTPAERWKQYEFRTDADF